MVEGLSMTTYRDRPAASARAWRRLVLFTGAAAVLSGTLTSLVPAAAQAAVLPSHTASVMPPQSITVGATRVVTQWQRLRGTATVSRPLVLAVPATRPGAYTAVIELSGVGTRRSFITVEGVKVAVARTTRLLTRVVSVHDGALTVAQGASARPVVTAVTATYRGPAPVLAPSPAPAVNGTTSPAPTATTQVPDLTLRPFSSTSIWNLPIAKSPTFESVGSPRTNALRTIGKAWANEGAYSHPVVRATASDPLVTVTDTRDASRSGNYRVPSAAPIAAGSDRHLHVINPAGTMVDEAWAVERLSPTSYRVGRHETVDLRGNGIGPSNGTRAYGGSAIGGLIRAWEVDPTHPAYTGRIEHAVAIALRSDQLLYSGGNPGYIDGYGTARGYVWPATEQDWDSPRAYSGSIPMGTYLAIPGDVDLSTLGLSPQGLMLARAYQDYGAYVTDRSGDPILAYVEPSAAGKAFANALLGPNWTASDLNKIRALLRIVTNNSASTPNGTSLQGERRRPLQP